MSKLQRITLVALSIVMVSLGCNRRSNRNAEADLAKVQASIQKFDEGFRNLTFVIQEYKAQPNGSHVFRLACNTPGSVGGFEVVLSEDFQTPVKFDPPVSLAMCKGTVGFQSLGIESDGFIKYLDKRYDTNLRPQRFKSAVRFKGVSGPLQLANGLVRIQISSGESGEPAFTSASLDIDLPAKRFELNEINPEYRMAMVKALAIF